MCALNIIFRLEQNTQIEKGNSIWCCKSPEVNKLEMGDKESVWKKETQEKKQK